MVAFLFTDVEGSTRLWEAHPVETGGAVAVHDAILRDAISSHEGHVFSTGGDAFCAAFSSVRAALDTGVAAQIALLGLEVAKEPLRVRMAVHVGEAEERDGDYFGPVLNRCARLMAAGHGGQLLLSGAAAELAGHNLPERLVLVDLGEHRLKDLSASERIFEVRHPDLEATFPPLRTLDAVLNNLPSQVTAFFGREREVADIGRLMTDHRLVTITGVGGGGKTRLAFQVGAEMLDRFPNGVWFINLGPITNPALVADTVATALGLRPPPNRPVIDSLETYLLDRTALLLMDNCEHLIDEVASVVSRLIAATRTTRVLATSRERLGITGERLCPIRPLPPPEPNSDRAVIEANPAVQMFVDRATALNSTFNVSSERLLAIADICRRLDGIPLAIELAAARTISLSPHQIASHLDQRLRILTVGDRTAPPHHQTLRATIDWSYQLLNPSERTLFHRLSIFGSSFSLEAAQEICTDTRLAPIDVIDLLPALVEESLVTADHAPTATRYRLLETISEYASEQLATAGEIDLLEHRHATYYLQLAEDAEPNLRTAKQHETAEMFEMEHDNFRQALQWAIDTDQTEIGLRLAGALWRFWYDKSHLLEGRRWLDALLAVDNPVADSVRAKALAGAGSLVIERQDMPYAISCLEEAADIYRRLADQGRPHPELASAVHNLAVTRFFELGDRERAEPLFEEALILMKEAGSQWGTAMALQNLGLLALRQGELGRARTLIDESVALSRGLGSWRLATAYLVASDVDLEFGDHADAIHHLEQAVEGYVEAGDLTQAHYARSVLGLAHLGAGNLDQAVKLFIPNAIAVLADPEYRPKDVYSVELAIGRVGIDLALGKTDRAAILLGALDQMIAEGASFGHAKNYGLYRGEIERLLDPETLDKILVRGATMTREKVWSLITEPILPETDSS